MKSLNTVLTLLTVGILSNSAIAANFDDGQQIHQPVVGKEKIKSIRSNKVRQDSLYYIQLQDQPLSTYSGDLTGYQATSIMATNGKNTNEKGILDIRSTSSRNYLSYLSQKQNRFVAQANQLLKRNLDVRHNYKTVLNAVAAKLTPTEAKLLMKQQNVKSVEKIGMHYIQTDSGPEFIQAKDVWEGVSEHLPTKGEGVIVGIIDTGINAYHPSFADIGGDGYDHVNPLGEGNYMPGDCTEFPKFCNDKLIGMVSYDLIKDQRTNVIDENYEDLADKIKVGYDFNAHGSHVASTAAGNILKDVPMYLSIVDDIGAIVQESEFDFEQISGVAPHANIVSYQVCNDDGCWPELTIEAIEHAIENGVNVLNYSVGGGFRDPWSSLDTMAFLNAREAGIHVATSAGNAGSDAQTIGAPGNSPWITTVAAYTHDRSFSEKMLTDFTGGESTLENLTGLAATAGYTGKVVHAAAFGDAGCLTPFAEGTFAGEIVVCERGDIARVRKGLNVQLGGAGGLVLVNTEGGAASVNADNHVVPAIHLNAENGTKLTNWLDTGTDHELTITGSTLIRDENLGDIAGVFTSRGPNLPYATIFAPDVAAPGVDIYAANSEDHPWTDDVVEVPYTTMSGTSMSSPHVAGALALIHAVHPDWTPSEVQSALMTTASHYTYKDDDSDGEKDRSDFFDQGAGSVRIANAIKAGFLLNITKQEYIDADPLVGGNPTELNTSSIASERCITECSWTRTIKATADSSWAASYEYMNPGVTVSISPANFTMAAGEEKVVTITAKSNIDLEDEWTHSFVQLTPSNKDLSEARFQVQVNFVAGKSPEEVSADINNVNTSVTIEDIITSGSNDLQVKGFGLAKVKEYQGTALGAGPNDYDKEPHLHLETIFLKKIIVLPYTKRLIASITDSTSPDMDLFVGLDEDEDGAPNWVEMYYSVKCISGNIDSNEHCVVENPQPGTYWVFAHNFEGTQVGEPDDVTMEISMINYTDDPSFDITAPMAVAEDELFDINVEVKGAESDFGYQDLEPGNKYYGLVDIGTKANLKRNVGQTLLTLNAIENQATLTTQVTDAVVGDDIEFSMLFPANTMLSASQSYTVTVELPDGLTFVSSSMEVSNDDGLLTWQFDQAAGSEDLKVSLVVSTDAVNSSGEFSLTANYVVDGGPSTTLMSTSFMVTKPIQALINDSESLTLTVNEGTENIELSALMSSPSHADDTLTYTWQQVGGNELALSASDMGTVTFITPTDISATSTYSYQVTVSNGTTSDIADVSITVNNIVEQNSGGSSSGGGSTGIIFLMMAAAAVALRKKA